jgi:hypothetical protein
MKKMHMTLKKKLSALAAGALMMTFAATANASLIGSTLSYQYYFNGGALGSPGSFVVNGGIGANVFGVFNILADNTSITFDYSPLPSSSYWSPSPLSLAPTIYNGIAINMVSGPAFTSVTLDPSSNMAGFTASSFSFSGSQIQVDWAATTIYPTTIVKLNVSTSSPTNIPEPASLALLGLGLLGMAARRQGNRQPESARKAGQ